MQDVNPVDIFEKGREQVIQSEYNGVPLYVIPKDMRVEALSSLHKEQQEKPFKLKQETVLLSKESFIEYFNRFADAGSTIFVDNLDGKFVAVLDYHQDRLSPRWGDHKAIFRCEKSKEWSRWLDKENEKMEQEDFALFMEEMANDILEPNAAEMLEIASTLKANKNVDFRSSIRLEDGQTQFTYNEVIDGQAGHSGQLSIPEKIVISTRPLHNGAPYQMEARFRYRLYNSKLIMWYSLIRPHLVLEHAINEAVDYCKEQMETGSLYLSSC